MVHPLIVFIAFGIIGWILDTIYRSAAERKYAPKTFIPYFSILYAVGGSILYGLHVTTTLNSTAYVLIGTLIMTLMEFTAGVFCQNILGERYWDYSKNKYNIYGHIDAIHILLWITLITSLRILLEYLA